MHTRGLSTATRKYPKWTLSSPSTILQYSHIPHTNMTTEYKYRNIVHTSMEIHIYRQTSHQENNTTQN